MAYDGAPHPWVDAFLSDRLGVDGVAPELSIDRSDEMLEQAYLREGGDWDVGLTDYFVSAFEIVDSLEQVAQWRFGGLDQIGSFLDFGCGYGRAMRLIAQRLSPEKIWVSDLYSEAMKFQVERFGVHSLESSPVPEKFRPGRKFDLVYVGSLFTHLPDATFGRWLKALLEVVEEEGLLAFTVHDSRLVPPGHRLPEEEILFLESSESHTHDLAEYGSSWVSENYVRAQLAAIDPTLSVHCLPRGICRYQDLFVVGRDPESSLTDFRFDPGPLSTVETCCSEQPGELTFSGWATYGGVGPDKDLKVTEVQILVDGVVVGRTSEFKKRLDLVEALGRDDVLESGFQCVGKLQVPVQKSATVVQVKALSESGRETTLWLGSLERALSYFNRQNWESSKRTVKELTAKVEWMESSRFWRLRNRWFSVKRALGLER